jgi:hypothetical protein
LAKKISSHFFLNKEFVTKLYFLKKKFHKTTKLATKESHLPKRERDEYMYTIILITTKIPKATKGRELFLLVMTNVEVREAKSLKS